MTATVTLPPSRATIGLSAVGAALIALAFAAPLLGALMNLAGMSALKAGEDSVRTLGSLALLALISWAVTRGRSERAKAVGRLVVGVLLCAVVGTNLVRAYNEAQDAKVFLVEARQFREEQAQRFAALAQRFDKMDLSQVLSPETLIAPGHNAAARAILANYRALLAERRSAVQTYLLQMERFVNERAPAGQVRDGARAGMIPKKEATEKLYAGLDAVQTEMADSLERVLDWGAAQGPRLQVRNGQLQFSSAGQQQELQRLLGAVTSAEEKHNTTTAAAQSAQQQAERDLKDYDRKAEALLAQ
jgi:hypothetical protein